MTKNKNPIVSIAMGDIYKNKIRQSSENPHEASCIAVFCGRHQRLTFLKSAHSDFKKQQSERSFFFLLSDRTYSRRGFLQCISLLDISKNISTLLSHSSLALEGNLTNEPKATNQCHCKRPYTWTKEGTSHEPQHLNTYIYSIDTQTHTSSVLRKNQKALAFPRL